MIYKFLFSIHRHRLTYLIQALSILMFISGCRRNTYMPEEGALQEPAWSYFERLSLAFGCDSTRIGMSSDMDFPDWYSGCYINSNDRLTINIMGDTTLMRPMIEKILGGTEFDLGNGICSKREQKLILSRLRSAIENDSTPLTRNIRLNTKEDGSIEIALDSTDDSTIVKFRKNVFDSPILRIYRNTEHLQNIYPRETSETDL